MINVLLVDDHPALRAGLMAVLRTEPGIVPVGTASCPEDLWPQFERTRPDLVLLDYHLPGTDGLVVCRRLKRLVPAPAVLIYSAYADASFTIPALLAGADGFVHKGVPANVLSDAIRTVARGQRVMPPVPAELRAAAAARIDTDDQASLGMTLAGTAPGDVAEILRIRPAQLDRRLDGMIQRLRVEVPSAAESAPRAAGRGI